jgi:pyrroloquinoline quinone biosynthesis protein B
MRITVLGSAAGGGFPQWNCNCHNCAGVRSGAVKAKPRTQSSIFVQGRLDAQGHAQGVLVNASPDILSQIRSHPTLQPGRAPRDSAIAGVVLMDGQIDHCTGLFMLREHGGPLPLWCTDAVAEDLLQGNPVLRVLTHYCGVQRHRIVMPPPLSNELPPRHSSDAPGAWFEVPGADGLRLCALPLSSKAAPYSPHRESPEPGDNIGVVFKDQHSGKTAFYAPGLGAITPPIFDAMCSADVVLVDGTFWTDDEMPKLGLSTKTARQMGHLPQSGPGGMLECLAKLPATTRRLLIHINNTNPILDEDSPQRATLWQAGVEVCEDNMEILL